MKLVACVVSACLAAADASAQSLDRAKLDEARSLVAEAAALRDAEVEGRVTKTYAAGLRKDICDDLVTLHKAPGLGPIVQQALSAMDRGDGPSLLRLRDRLVMLERSHGRAD